MPKEKAAAPLLALVMDKGHQVLLTRQGDRWALPTATPRADERPLVTLSAHVAEAYGLADLPGPVGSFLQRQFAFILPETPTLRGETRWVPLRDVWAQLDAPGSDQAWRLYVETVLGGFEPRTRALDVFHFANTPAVAAKLAHCVVKGTKRATSGWTHAMETTGETIPRPGMVSVVTDYFGLPQCVIETVEVRHVPFSAVGADVAAGEGEGDLSLEDWREGHLAYWRKEAAELALPFDESSLVFNEFFRVVRVLGRDLPHAEVDRQAAAAAQAQLEAYNAGDLDAFVACYAPDVELRTLGTDEPFGKGHAFLRERYGKVFRECPTLHCELQNRIVTGSFVFDQEWVTGRDASGVPTRVTAGYEVRDGLIVRAWFAR